ncbi:IS66 family transposase [Specibacter cremeus]|uniref:IS66 family transposase n=1 Tax=Specibacter cremeus TaxID=1629051 RepID=UPI000F76C802|nr:IS66 family transposase [Specibacter cremeus]
MVENVRLRLLVAGLQETVARQERANQVLAERVAELEARLGQSPRNSSRPPSSEGYEKPAPRSRRQKTDRPSGGQPGHTGHTLEQVTAPDEVLIHAPAMCGGCGESLAGAPVVSTESRQVVDLPPITVWTTEHRIEHRRCSCGCVTMAQAPAGVGAPVQYGPRVRALGVYLLTVQHLPLQRTAELMGEVVGAPVSQGSLVSWQAAAAAGLDGVDETLVRGLSQAEVLGADETGIRVNGKLVWVHAARTDQLTRYTVSRKRGYAGMEDAGVLTALKPTTVLVTDFFRAYWNLDVIHAACGAHLSRELVAGSEVDGQDGWAEPLERLLAEINRVAHRARDAGGTAFAPALLATYRRRYEALIKAGWATNPGFSPGKHATKRPKHVNLLDRLDGHREEVLRYATDWRVPFSNNGSERDIRPLKIKMKVSGGLRSMAGADAFCRLRSYLSTAAKQGQTAFEAMTMLHNGNPWQPATS